MQSVKSTANLHDHWVEDQTEVSQCAGHQVPTGEISCKADNQNLIKIKFKRFRNILFCPIEYKRTLVEEIHLWWKLNEQKLRFQKRDIQEYKHRDAKFINGQECFLSNWEIVQEPIKEKVSKCHYQMINNFFSVLLLY